jgi:outer membrane lipoprotein LolB
MLRKVVLLVVLSITLTACVPIWQTRSDKSPEILWQERQRQLLHLNNWNIQGRTVIRDKQEAWNVGLRWQQKGEKFQIQLLGPFAQGGVLIKGDGQQVPMTLDDGQKLLSTNVEELITKTLGVDLPINALRDWVRGLPYQASTMDVVEYDEKGQITHLVQQSWNVDFKRYVPFKHYTLPSKVFITQADRSLRLVITSWKDSK